MTDMQPHEASLMFPELGPEEYDALKRSIAQRGVLSPVHVHEGQILDGRHRWRACSELGVDCPTVEWEPTSDGDTPLDFVLEANCARRQLTREQRDELIRELHRRHRRSLRWIAARVGCSEGTVRNALARAQDYAPDDIAVTCGDSEDTVFRIGNDGKAYRSAEHRIASDADIDVGAVHGDDLQAAEDARRDAAVNGTIAAEDVFDELGVDVLEDADDSGSGKHAGHMKPGGGSESDEWYTDRVVLEAVYATLGGPADLDPCSNDYGDRANVCAGEHLTIDDDGLTHPWRGKVFVNPPYGRALADWVRKCVSEFQMGEVDELILLVPNSTATSWYHSLSPFPRCHLYRRAPFMRPDGSLGAAPPYPTMVVYMGSHDGAFREAFRDLGGIWECTTPWTGVESWSR